jgi:hypothetical protein
MDHILRVTVLNCAQYLVYYRYNHPLSQLLLLNDVVEQLAALTKVHDYIEVVLVLKKLIDLDYTWVIHRLQQLDFVKKLLLLRGGRLNCLLVQDLNCSFTSCDLVRANSATAKGPLPQQRPNGIVLLNLLLILRHKLRRTDD